MPLTRYVRDRDMFIVTGPDLERPARLAIIDGPLKDTFVRLEPDGSTELPGGSAWVIDYRPVW